MRLAVLLAVWAFALSACSSLPWNRKQAQPGAAEAVELREMYRLEVAAPKPLKELLSNFLDLARFRRAPEADRITIAELDRLVAAAPAQARSLVETQGYFNSQARARRDPAGADGLPVVHVELDPGPRTIVSDIDIAANGPVKQAADAGDAAAQQLLAEMRDKWPLEPGRPFSQSAWDDAKGSALGALRVDGYPAADWAATSARIDAAANRAQLYALADSGPLFRIGEIRVEGIERYRASDASNLTTFQRGDRYTEKALLDTQDRLQRSGLFEGAIVHIDPDPAHADAAPVTVRVREAPLQQATVGLGFSDATGERITLEHTHRRVFGITAFGTYWTSKTKIELGRSQQSWQGDLSSHPLPGGWRNLVGFGLQRETAAGTTVTSSRLRTGRAIETEHIDRLIFVELTQARTSSSVLQESSRSISGNYNWVWRDLDSVLLPTRGLAMSIDSALGHAWADRAENGPFGRLRGRLTGFRPLGDTWYGSARIELGQVFARPAVGVPDTLLFRAGGDDSVRGYAYRSLGPLAAGVVTSGKVLLTASGEVARPITARLPSVWWALFVDAGDAADTWSGLKPVYGYGTGIRWRSPVGPLRLDLAYADELRKFRFHLSVGVTF